MKFPGRETAGVSRADVTAAVAAAVAALVAGAPGALDTLNELATALADDAAFATTVTNALAGKIPASLVDAAGDLIVGTADNTVTRLPLGAALQALRVNAGGTALEYADPVSGPTTRYLYVHMSANDGNAPSPAYLVPLLGAAAVTTDLTSSPDARSLGPYKVPAGQLFGPLVVEAPAAASLVLLWLEVANADKTESLMVIAPALGTIDLTANTPLSLNSAAWGGVAHQDGADLSLHSTGMFLSAGGGTYFVNIAAQAVLA